MNKTNIYNSLAGIYRSIWGLTMINIALIIFNASVHFPAGFVSAEVATYIAAFRMGYDPYSSSNYWQQTGIEGMVPVIMIVAVFTVVLLFLASMIQKGNKQCAWIATLLYIADLITFKFVPFDAFSAILHGYLLFQAVPLVLAMNKNVSPAPAPKPPTPQPLSTEGEVIAIHKDELPKSVEK